VEEAPLLSLDRASARYREEGPPALAPIDLTLAPGEIVAVLGPNGSGKSTLLRLAAGLLPPAEGRVRIAGEDPAVLGRRGVSRVVALVPQSEPVAAGFRVREIVAMGRAPHQEGWMRPRPEDDAAVASALARCDLMGLAERDVATLSGGEQRRVAIARAFAQRPRVLLLDEPAAFLDLRHRLELSALLESVAAEGRAASLVAMHDLDAASRLATRIVLLRGLGAPGDVLTAPLLREAFDVDLEIETHAGSGARTFVAVGVAR
jgi:iron complex transport system ATP-binding protein